MNLKKLTPLTISSDLKDYDIRTSDAMKNEFRKQVQEKFITALVAQLKERGYQMQSNWKRFQYWTLQKFQKSQQMASQHMETTT